MNNGHSAYTEKPWGRYQVLCKEPGFCVKKIEVDSNHRLSLQKHAHRVEKWIVVSGEGLARSGDREKNLHAGESIDIPIGEVHRMSNQGSQTLVFIEVSFGSYIEEDDIIRLEDDYDRS